MRFGCICFHRPGKSSRDKGPDFVSECFPPGTARPRPSRSRPHSTVRNSSVSATHPHRPRRRPQELPRLTIPSEKLELKPSPTSPPIAPLHILNIPVHNKFCDCVECSLIRSPLRNSFLALKEEHPPRDPEYIPRAHTSRVNDADAAEEPKNKLQCHAFGREKKYGLTEGPGPFPILDDEMEKTIRRKEVIEGAGYPPIKPKDAVNGEWVPARACG